MYMYICAFFPCPGYCDFSFSNMYVSSPDLVVWKVNMSEMLKKMKNVYTVLTVPIFM